MISYSLIVTRRLSGEIVNLNYDLISKRFASRDVSMVVMATINVLSCLSGKAVLNRIYITMIMSCLLHFTINKKQRRRPIYNLCCCIAMLINLNATLKGFL